MGWFNTAKVVSRKAISKVGHAVKHIGHFVAQHHREITGLAHAAAIASGNKKLQDVTGAAVGVSQLASAAENALSGRIAAMRAQHASPTVGVPVGFKGG